MAPPRAREIVVCGHLCLDIIPGFPALEGSHDWFRPGRLSLVGAPVISTGGAVSNVGLSLHRLGLPVRLVAKIGNDPLGRLIFERVSAMGKELARGLGRAEGEVTSYTVVLNPPGPATANLNNNGPHLIDYAMELYGEGPEPEVWADLVRCLCRY